LVCRDFYTAANGEWLDTAVLPTDATVADTSPTLGERQDTISLSSWETLKVSGQRTMIRLLSHARTVAATTTDPVLRVLGTFYGSCLVSPPQQSGQSAQPGQPTQPGSGAPEADSGVARCVMATRQSLESVLSRAYLQYATTPATVARVRALTEQLRDAMAIRIRALPTLSPVTRAQAEKKLAQMRFLIAAPEHDIGYDTLTLSPTDYTANLAAIHYVDYHKTLERQTDPDTTLRPSVSSYTINAFYRANINAIEIPVTMFQEPWYNPARNTTENYAGLGMVLGHELSHAFDGEGFRGDTTDTATWTQRERAAYQIEAHKLIAEYDRFVVGDAHVSGERTLHENVADLGGVNVAFDVYMRAVKAGTVDVDRTTPGVAQPTPAQRFFLTYAGVWRVKARPKHGLDGVLDVHSAHQWRVNGVLAAMPAFAQAFGCKAGDPMALAAADRPLLW